MARTTSDNEIISAEKQYWDAIQHKDAATAMQLSDEFCIVVGAQGIREVDRDELAQLMSRATSELTRYSLDEGDIHIRKLSDDVAIIAYRVREDLVVNGKPESLQAFDASVWVRRDGSWVCAMHTESLRGDPFGRRDFDPERFATD